jgi:hypothetical protein
MRMKEEKMGGCIDPKTLAALLSSITSVTYELNIIGVHHVPKDPFKNVKRFLNAWATWQGMAVRHKPPTDSYLI